MFTSKRKRRAKNLVHGANILAISSLELFVGKIRTVDMLLREGEDVSWAWDFFYTIACVGAALSLGGQGVAEEEMSKHEKYFTAALLDFDDRAMHALTDMMNFCALHDKPGIPPWAGTGHWLLLNVAGRQITDDELVDAIKIGQHIYVSMDDWYNTCG
jgi:hypothetical protein